MWTYVADRVIEAAPPTVAGTASAVVQRVWGAGARLVAESDDAGRLYAIDDADGGAEVWLTIRIRPTDGGVRVTLLLDEVEPGPDATDGLDQILDLIGELVGVP